MNEREYSRLKAKVEKQYRDDLAALERVWEMAQTEAPLKTPTPEPPESESGLSPVKVAREAIPQVPQNGFTVRDMESAIRLAHPEINGSLNLAVLSKTLKRLADDGEIRVKQIGRGKRPTLYEVPMRT